MKSVAGTLKLDLAQFRELEAFATFGSELDAVSKAQLERGARLVELLKQGLHAPMPVEEQVVSIYAGTNGYLDDIPATDVRRFERELLDYIRTRHADILSSIKSTGAMPERASTASWTSSKRLRADRRRGHGRDGAHRRGSGRRGRVRRDAGNRVTATVMPDATRRPRSLASERTAAERVSRSAESERIDMAGGQERILRRRIKSVAVDEEDHARDGAHRGDRGS